MEYEIIELIKFKRGPEQLWKEINPILEEGEPGYETDSYKLKIGNGTTAWNDLKYISGGATFIPHIDEENGILYWTNEGNYPNPNPIKIIGENGKDGYTPVKGVDYFDGKDGYIPIKGVDYFDGKDGTNGKDGYTPQKNIDYFDGENGEDGVSCSHEWNGTVLTVTSASGTSSVDLKGADGATPIRGTDYWTPEDVAEIKSNIDNKLTDCVKYEDTIYIEVDTADRNEDSGELRYDDSLVVHIDGFNRKKRYVLLLKYMDDTNIEMIPLTQRYDTGMFVLQGVDFGHSNIIYLENGIVYIEPIPCMYRPTGYIVADEYNNIDVDKEALLGDIGDITAKEYVDNKIGDIETALDNIITLQNSLIGGDGV